MLEFTIDNTQKVTGITVNPLTADGKPALVDGIPEWTIVSGPGTAVPSADGLSGQVLSQNVIDPDPLKNITVVSISADADRGAGIETITDTVTITVIDQKAVSLGLAGGNIVPK